MTRDEIREFFDGFIEYPEGSEKLYVTTASTLIFAQHVAKIATERERDACAKVCEDQASASMQASNKAKLVRDSESYRSAAIGAKFCIDRIRARSTP